MIRENFKIRRLVRILFLSLVPLQLLTLSCSLVTIESEVEPLPKKEINTRFMTHEFGAHFAAVVEEAADSILSKSSDLEIQINALRWKIHTVSAIRKTIFQVNPTAGLIDTWAFCSQMRQFFQEGNGKEMFGAWQPVAVDASAQLEKDIAEIAKSMCSSRDYESYRGFVIEYVAAHPIEEITFFRESILAQFKEFLGVSDSVAISTVGTLPQVMTDFTSRSMILSEQIPNVMSWRTELYMKNSGWDSVKVQERLDSLGTLLDRYATIAENSPQLIDSSLKNLSTHLLPLIDAIDKQRIETLEALSLERAAVTGAIRQGRMEITADVERISNNLLDSSLTHLRKIIRSILFWGLLFVIVLLGVPFTLGFIVGKTIRKKT